MLKKVLLTTAISFTLLTGYTAASAERGDAVEPVENQVEAVVAETQEAVVDNYTQKGEEIFDGHKLTQEEKAQNAKENDSFGGGITIVAMCIVLFALIVLSLLFLGFGKISSMFMSKKKLEAHGISKEEAGEDHSDPASGEAIAAIAMALAQHFDKGHDMEDTTLTIRRMKKAYSPWNSKIYNMRQVPELRRNASKR
jgi:Na+-transporting methylmalonyl-CoA/oxaloacetate decarboxylase gamma subunit